MSGRGLPGPVVAVVGPTAAGKSDLGIALALALGGEVVNADSMQLYRGMDIGTAKVPLDERRGVPHHLLDAWEVTRAADVASYQHDARRVIDGLLAVGRVPVLVGGSGLYLRAALDDLTFPGTDPAVRARWEEELARRGAPALHEELARRAPRAAAAILPTNGRRLVRALEVVDLTGTFEATLPEHHYVYDVIQIGVDRDDLDIRIEQRVERMWQTGFPDEVRQLSDKGLRDGRTASRALGYAQLLAWLDGAMESADQAKLATITATRRFARRQRSWFRRDERIVWLRQPDVTQALRLVGSL
ncbi:tRNA dimethylallyltransferase [Frankia canadensis]|uniref:tRNA dimethylallyltransferase n=1 Tax=Frankia canadensis TaxID=1836972 RepID=A0A2I2KTQ8_9ACTN|nr:tRNA (adenosine(37)-N6)-dimethylallyltransferase MiaA [Frankia canadensis]SNQ49058.1 tRNA dimethylallyltransferase [Frankia canadensis]SOU56348.1 tRNA dimethylallyltransferase [Frankia canadensis]